MASNDHEPPDNVAFLAALDAMPETADIVAQHLRMMAKGQAPYRRFTYAPRWIKNIWAAAADLIENQTHDKLH